MKFLRVVNTKNQVLASIFHLCFLASSSNFLISKSYTCGYGIPIKSKMRHPLSLSILLPRAYLVYIVENMTFFPLDCLNFSHCSSRKKSHVTPFFSNKENN